MSSDLYLIAFDDLALIPGSTEVYTESVTGLVTAIGLKTVEPIAKFVKVGTVLNQGSITENYTASENGTFDIVKALIFSITNLGSVDAKALVESLMGQPIGALVKLNSGNWVALGLNGQFQLQTSVGTINGTDNSRVLTLQGSDSQLVQVVDPTIITALLAA